MKTLSPSPIGGTSISTSIDLTMAKPKTDTLRSLAGARYRVGAGEPRARMACDLQVLSTKEPAMRLYLRAGFTKVGEVAEMFKFDGRSFSETRMTKRLREDRTH